MFFLSCVCYFFVRVCLYVLCGHLLAEKGLTSWLSFVVSNCEFITFPLVSWVRCGTRLYRFLIFASLLTLNIFYQYQIFTLDTHCTIYEHPLSKNEKGVYVMKSKHIVSQFDLYQGHQIRTLLFTHHNRQS